MLILEWSRQIGKSHTLANWAIDRVISQLGKPENRSWLVVVISNSKSNGAEFGVKVGEAAEAFRQAVQSVQKEHGITEDEMKEFGIELEDCQFKLSLRMKIDGVEKVGRIIVLSSSPRTARGFSGDLILDEFAHHMEARALWAAAEPFISSRPEFLIRVASTHSTTGSLFYKWVASKKFPVSSVTRTQAWLMSRHDSSAPLIISSLISGDEITPEQAREEADDQRNYDCNYENNPHTDSGALLSLELINRAQVPMNWKPDAQEWSESTLERLRKIDGPLYAGLDVGRKKDLSVLSVIHLTPDRRRRLVAMLVMKGMPHIPHQSTQIIRFLDSTRWVKRLMVDATGEGIGLTQYLEHVKGSRVQGIHFASYVRIVIGIGAGGKKIEQSVPVTEQMGNDILTTFRDGIIDIPAGDIELENSLHLPEKVVSQDGTRVMIASSKTKDEEGYTEHADRFWSIALCEHGIRHGKGGAFTAEDVRGVAAGAVTFRPNVITFTPPVGGGMGEILTFG
jgi:phage FluMu gp28-like protein